jgi:hypothetical protein
LRVWNEKRAAGAKVTAWVNPFDPGDAVLTRSPHWMAWLTALAGLLALWMFARRGESMAGDQ